MRPPARRGHRGLRPGGKLEWGMRKGECGMVDLRVEGFECGGRKAASGPEGL
jgi:hypothetical protein